MKITIQKPVGILGEVWLVEVPVTNDVMKSKDPVAGIEAATSVATRVMDNRLLQLNLRLLEHNRVAQTLTGEQMLAVRQCVELMYGSLVGVDGPNRPQVTAPAETSDAGVQSKLEKALEAVDQGGA